MILVFELTMPHRNSWNGMWSGEGNLYAIVKNFGKSKKAENLCNTILEKTSYSYSWSDGWGARVRVYAADVREANKIRRKSQGFCGYDWMVDSIIKRQKILTSTEAKAID